MIDYNLCALNSNDLSNSFFCLSKTDPTVGFLFDASKLSGYAYPPEMENGTGKHLSTLDTLGERIGRCLPR